MEIVLIITQFTAYKYIKTFLKNLKIIKKTHKDFNKHDLLFV